MSQWHEVLAVFAEGKSQWMGLQQQMQGLGTDGIMETGQLLALHCQKPGVEWLAEVQRRLSNIREDSGPVFMVQNELGEIEETVRNYRDFMRNYRTEKEAFQRLIKSCIENNVDIETYLSSLEDWRNIRELLIECPLFEKQLVKEFVALDCLFQILYYMAGPNRQEHNKYKSKISELISKWEVEDLLMEQDSTGNLLNSFYSSSKDRFSLLGKREKLTQSANSQTKFQTKECSKKGRTLPIELFSPTTERAFKMRHDCPQSLQTTSSKRLSGTLEMGHKSKRHHSLSTHEANDQPTSQLQLHAISKNLTNLTYAELCETVKDRDLDQQQEVAAFNHRF